MARDVRAAPRDAPAPHRGDRDMGELALPAWTHETSDIVAGLLRRMRLPWLLRHHRRRPVLAFFAVVNSAVGMCVLAFAAVLTGSPFVIPSLGPSAFLLFYRPTASSASPRNTLVGHALGAASGYVALIVTGLRDAPPALSNGMTGGRVVAVGLALVLTTGAMVLLSVEHPPAVSTALVVALGTLTQLWQLGVVLCGVALLALQALLINRAAGVPYPLWNPLPRRERP